ncbi:MAG TPA: hypothetical protein VJ806_15405 [Luteimonas sp.]|nr:hypothetical protein [Luteimonas sp.]
MSFVRGLVKVAAGAGAGVAVVTALPLFGAVGTITAAGLVVGSLLGAAAGVADEVAENKKDKAGGKSRNAVKRRRQAP